MVLLGLIAVMIASGLQLGARATDMGDERAAAADRVRLVQSFLRRQLSQARPVQRHEVSGAQSAVFSGTPRALQFVAPPPAHHAWGGLQLIRLDVERGEKGERLVLSYRMLALQQAREPGQPERVVLLDNMEKLEFAYLRRERAGEPAVWQDRWQDTYRLPGLVRLSGRMRNDREVHWPELVVALHGG